MRTKFYSVNSAKSIFLVNEATFIKKIIWPHHLTRKKVLEFWEYDLPAFLLYYMKKAVIKVYDVTTNMFICFLRNDFIARKGYELRFKIWDNIFTSISIIYYEWKQLSYYGLRIDNVKLYGNLLLPSLFSNQITLIYILGLTCLSC